MFHTFQSSVALRSPDQTGSDGGAKPARASGSRRISTSNACVECRRRKIRCDGTQPCGQCQWYQHPEACSYSKPAQRVVPSRKLVDKLQGNIEQRDTVLQRLFPGKGLETLVSLPREELLNLALSAPAATSPSSTTGAQPVQTTSPNSEGTETSLEALEQAPDQNPEWDEVRRYQDKIQNISDDVNGLSMSVDRLASYVGISSITTALKVIVKAAPVAKPYIYHEQFETAQPSRANSPPPQVDDDPLALPSLEEGRELLNAYYERVHQFFPMVDMDRVWNTFTSGDRTDSPWLALLNIIFALGSLASGTSNDDNHLIYFQRSRQHLSLESFGSGNMEVIQALGIMSGYYMHYLNRPNEAHGLMGGTLRMATALGLHREYNDSATSKANVWMGWNGNSMPQESGELDHAEVRRRTWWSLFCLDAWASTTTGRPSLGRWSPAVTVQGPGKVPIPNRGSNSCISPTTPQDQSQLRILPLIHNTEFCKICTQVQDRLATTPLPKLDEVQELDSTLVRWYEDLPTILSTNQPCPEFLRIPRSVMKWRYQNLRIVLHRPFLLSAALRRTPFSTLSSEEKMAVGKCRIVAGKTIEDISNECTEDLISGWNAVWFMFQATMVPIVGLFCDSSNPDDVEKWQGQIDTAIKFLDRMIKWSVAAKKSRDFIIKLSEAHKNAAEREANQ
ncbi:hypothetical protein M501DRAFT_920109, partial [Patellaria atrata CBS 101060]